MPRFEPFAGIRYDTGVVDLTAVLAPPYDVIDAEARAALEARSPHNAVHIELPREVEGGADRYETAGRTFRDWLDKGFLVADAGPALYVYRMAYLDDSGRPRHTEGVIGALELSVPGEGDVLPHERTMPKPKDDRLNLLRACGANLSPVWALSLSPGLAALCEQPGPPIASATDDEGVSHSLWRVVDPRLVDAITEAVGAEPAVIADGHHRYETALAYRDERRAARAGTPGDYDWIMAYVVELADEQLTVRPIHRIVSGLPAGTDLLAALARWFEPFEAGAAVESLPARMAETGALGLVLPGGAWLLRPKPSAFTGEAAAAGATDSRLLDAALDTLDGVELRYHHDPAVVASLVDKGEAQAGVLLRPATVAQIAAAAHARRRMPEKTTFFHPKPRTGLVFRTVRD